MGSRCGSRLAALLQTASCMLHSGRAGLDSLAAAGQAAGADTAALSLAPGSRMLPSAAHDAVHASLSAPAWGAAQHTGTLAGSQLVRSSTGASVAQEPASQHRIQREVQPASPSSYSASGPSSVPQPVEGLPHARSSKPPRKTAWQPETQQDWAAAGLADRMDALVRSGHPQAAMDLFEMNFQASRMARGRLFDAALFAAAELADGDTALRLLHRMWGERLPAGFVAHGHVIRALCRAGRLKDALQRLDERVAAGRATPAMCRTVVVAAMRAGDLLTADAAIAADDAVCERTGQPRQLDTWAQVIRLQGMKGGATAAEIAFTAAQLAAGTAPALHTAFISALARCGELSQALGALEDYVEVLPRPAAHATGPLPGILAASAALEPAASGAEAADSTAAPAAAPAVTASPVSLEHAAGGELGTPETTAATAVRLPGGLAAGQQTAQPGQAARVRSLLALAVSELVSAAEAAADAATARAAIDILLQAGHFVEPNVWNAALRAAVNARVDPALLDDLFEDMLLTGIPGDGHTYAALTRGYAQAGDLQRALGILDHMVEAGIGEEQPHVYTALLGAAAAVGDATLAQRLYATMAERGVQPNQATFCALFQCAAAAGAAWHRRRFSDAGGEDMSLQLDRIDAEHAPSSQDSREPDGSYMAGVGDRDMEFIADSSSSSSGSVALDGAAADRPDADGVEAAHAAPTSSRDGQTQQQKSAAAGYAMEADEQDAFVQQQLWLEGRQEPLALLQGWVNDFEALQLKHSPATLTSLVKAYGALNEAREAVALLQRAGGWVTGASGTPVAQAPAYGAALVAAARTFDTHAVASIEGMLTQRSVPLNAHLYASLISACAVGTSGTPSKRLQRARDLHSQMLGAGVQTNVHVENQLMRVHCHAGDLAGAVAVLQDLSAKGIEPNRYSWALLMSAARHTRNADFAQQVLAMMPHSEQPQWLPQAAWMHAALHQGPPQPLYASSDDDWGF